MATHVVKNSSIYRTGVVLKTKANFISTECEWDVTLPKLLFHTEPHFPSISLRHFNPIRMRIYSSPYCPVFYSKSPNYPNITWNPDLHRMQKHNRVQPQ
jgi:hypothetical protein